ncbi:MAG: hypothetical protein ABIT70_02240 [Sulfuriferula sp.]
MRRAVPSLPRHQRGALLILLVIALGILAATVFVSMLSSSDIQNKRDKQTTAALAEAKAALIGWSASRSSNTSSYSPGQLPCPENTSLIGSPNEGTGYSSCTLPAIGRLPWKTLKIGDLRDGYGEKLWYVLSPGFRVSPINSSVSQAQLTVDGIPNSAVAIIFSPGPPLAGQIRPLPTASQPPDITNYLEGNNNNGSYQFDTQGPTTTFNDKLLLITHRDLFSLVEKRIALTIIGTGSAPNMGLRYYYANNPPGYPPSLDYNQLNFDTYTKKMLTDNHWDSLVIYTSSSPTSAQLDLPSYCTARTTSGQAGLVSCP